MILGSLLLKRKETAVHGFVRRSFFFHKNGKPGRPQTTRFPEKNHSAGYAHSARGGHLNLSAQSKRPLHKIDVQRPFAILLCTLCAKIRRQWWKQPQKKQPRKMQPQRKQPRKMQPQRKRPRWKQPQKKQPRKQRWCLRKQPQRWRKQKRQKHHRRRSCQQPEPEQQQRCKYS